ncbi:Homoserine kinase [Nymphon striatum]|nr:Homoserine kinase [Nymphon striatum]
MSHYSVLNQADLNEILKQYDIETIDSFSLLSGGSENTNYKVRSGNRKFVLTICEQKTFANANDLAHLLAHLAKHDFETSKVIPNNSGDLVSLWNEKPIMLKNFLDGEIIEDLPNQIIENIGFKMGELHQIAVPDYLPKGLNYGQEYFHETSQYASNSSFTSWLETIHEYIKPYFNENLPKTLIHKAANYYRIFDVGMTIVGLCSENKKLNLEKMGYLLKGYQQIIALQEAEKKALQAFTVYAAAAMTFWRHRNFNHTNPDPEMFDHYLGINNKTNKGCADISNAAIPVSTYFKAHTTTPLPKVKKKNPAMNRLLDNRDLITTRLGSNSNCFSNECLMRFPVGVIKNLQY